MTRQMKRYTQEFKHQMVQLHISGKSILQITNEYDVGKSTLSKWVQQYKNSGSFKAVDNRSEEDNQLIKLQKENK